MTVEDFMAEVGVVVSLVFIYVLFCLVINLTGGHLPFDFITGAKVVAGAGVAFIIWAHLSD